MTAVVVILTFHISLKALLFFKTDSSVNEIDSTSYFRFLIPSTLFGLINWYLWINNYVVSCLLFLGREKTTARKAQPAAANPIKSRTGEKRDGKSSCPCREGQKSSQGDIR